MARPVFNLAQFEAIDGALSALLDACVDAGMEYANDDHAGWAAEYVANALVSA